jgi:asparagine synthase (glutamine-hydrolysing)
MCGIAGIVSPTGVSARSLGGMAATLRHRGPDGEGFALCSRGGEIRAAASLADVASMPGPCTVGLAHTRLSIIDLSHASDQPMLDPETRHALVYNGEIYNYLELRRSLIERGHRFSTTGDTEVVLRAYIEWGERCVERFVGMWAFAMLDPSRNVLFLSRDRFGIKPLYYWSATGTFCFASEIKALRAVPGVDPEPDRGVVAKYIPTGVVDDTDHTFFAGVLQLPPAHNMDVRLDGSLEARPWRYWAPPDGNGDESVADAVERFRAALEGSVRLHLRSDVAVGTCLSGGLDSSSIVCVAAKLRELGGVPTYAHHGFGYVPQDARYSEEPYMKEVASKARARMTYVRRSPERFHEVIVPVVRHHDEPFGSTSIVAQWFIFESARAAGIKVMLDGQGADETLGGYPVYLSQLATHLIRAHRLLAFARYAAAYRRQFGRAPISFVDVASRKARRGLRAVAPRARIGAGTVADIAADVVLPALGLPEPFPREHTRPSSLHEILKSQTMSMSLPALLRVEDRNSMFHSIEARVPFLDHRLVELLFRMPPDLKIRDARTKYVLREALAGTLPEAVRMRRDKVAFQADPSVTWRFASEHRDAILANRTVHEERWFNPAGVARALDPTTGSPQQEALAWRVMNTKLWLRSNWGESEGLLE